MLVLLTLESLQGGQVNLSTQLIKPNKCFDSPTDAAPQFPSTDPLKLFVITKMVQFVGISVSCNVFSLFSHLNVTVCSIMNKSLKKETLDV